MPKQMFPANRNLRARMEAVIEGLAECRSALETVRDFADSLPPNVRTKIVARINSALAAAATAGQAISED